MRIRRWSRTCPTGSIPASTRYTTSGFLRVKLGDALDKRNLAPHIYETAAEARSHLHDGE